MCIMPIIMLRMRTIRSRMTFFVLIIVIRMLILRTIIG